VVGLSGGYPAGFPNKVEEDFAKRLAAGKPSKLDLPQPEKIDGLEVRVIRKNTRATAISLGFPITVTRGDADWPALFLINSYFGHHRSANGRLYKRMRHLRGLNYGDYAYIEYFPRGMFQFHPDKNLARSQQVFQVWIRPVEPQNALFSLKIALYELRKLIETGISKEDFEETRLFLTQFVNVLTKSQDDLLGYALDSRFYGIPTFTDYVRDKLAALTLDDVNRVIKKHLTADNVKVIVVTNDAEGFAKTAVENGPSPITYPSPMSKEILDEDKQIQAYKLNLSPKKVEVIPVDQVFQK
jgi:zinc protease